jgi:hypothetical protein
MHRVNRGASSADAEQHSLLLRQNVQTDLHLRVPDMAASVK